MLILEVSELMHINLRGWAVMIEWRTSCLSVQRRGRASLRYVTRQTISLKCTCLQRRNAGWSFHGFRGRVLVIEVAMTYLVSTPIVTNLGVVISARITSRLSGFGTSQFQRKCTDQLRSRSHSISLVLSVLSMVILISVQGHSTVQEDSLKVIATWSKNTSAGNFSPFHV